MNEVLINPRASPLLWNDTGGVNLKGQIFRSDGTTTWRRDPGQFGGCRHRAAARTRTFDALELRRQSWRQHLQRRALRSYRRRT